MMRKQSRHIPSVAFCALVEELARQFCEPSKRQNQRCLVAVAGPPGAGKSTFAQALVARLNRAHETAIACLVPMDGFHYDNAVLDALGLRACKGAPQTFDAFGLIALLERLKMDVLNPIAIPLFDRARDLAVAGAARIMPQQRVVMVEGNYLLLGTEPWDRLRPLFDLSLMLAPPLDVLELRLVARWKGFGLPSEEIRAKVHDNDLPNARLVLECSVPADYVCVEEDVL